MPLGAPPQRAASSYAWRTAGACATTQSHAACKRQYTRAQARQAGSGVRLFVCVAVFCTDLSGKEPHRQVGLGEFTEPRWCNG